MSTQFKPTIKRGAAFGIAIQLINQENGQGVPITSSYEFFARLNNLSGVLIQDLVITPYPNQVDDAGWILLSAASTTHWPLGGAMWDLLIYDEGIAIYSDSQGFDILKTQTPLRGA